VRRASRSCRCARVQQPHPRRQRRRHVNHGLADSDELLREQSAETAGALDRPLPRLERRCEAQQTVALIAISDESELVDHGLGPVENRGGVGALVRVDPDGEQGGLLSVNQLGDAAAGQS